MRKFMGSIRDTFFFPLRCLFPNNEHIGWLGVTPLSDERFNAVKPYLKGKVLDLGCGDNHLIQEYRRVGGDGVGADLPSNSQADIFLMSGQPLPFSDHSFDTITVIAALNHIPDRERLISECYRCLVPGGHIVITMLNRVVGIVGHFLWRILGSDADLKNRHEEKGEIYGMSRTEVYNLLIEAKFTNFQQHSFSMGFNNLYIARRN